MDNPNSNARAWEIIRALIQGSDPIDNSPLPPDCVLNRSDVLRGLLTASAALQSVMARDARRSQLPKSVGKTWADDEEEDLWKEIEKGLNVEEIAAAHGRTVRAIELRAVMRGWMKASDRKTDNAFGIPTKKKRKRK